MEYYALSKDCEVMPTELIPGSDEHYFYHYLFDQIAGMLEPIEAFLPDWFVLRNGEE
ncbi:MAG: hypothetical protein L7W43_01860 [Rubripirellula sp.]|nr:hypothetical protein [Rubripirellula sp.]